MRLKIAFFCAPAILAGCATTGTFINGKGSLALDRAQLREINEAFKSTEDKSIEVPGIGEVECTDRHCAVPATVTAERVVEGRPNTPAKLEGMLVFRRDVAERLLALSRQAEYDAKPRGEEGSGGKVTCTKVGCTLEFTYDAAQGKADAVGTTSIDPKLQRDVATEGQ